MGSALGAQGPADGAGAAQGLCAPPGRGAGDPGIGLLAYRVPGLKRPAPPRGPWPRAHSGLGGGGSGTAAPSALRSRLGRGHPELWTPGRKGQARAGRRSQGDAGLGAAPPPRPAALGAAPGGAPSAVAAPAGSFPPAPTSTQTAPRLLGTARVAGTQPRSRLGCCATLGRSLWRFELGKARFAGCRWKRSPPSRS